MANLPYIVVSDIAMVETTVNKSRFIGVTFPVNNIDQVKEALGSLKKSNKDAKHIPYAYLLGEDFSVARNKKLISVMLEPVRLTPGVEMQLCVSQAIRYYDFNREEKFYEELFNSFKENQDEIEAIIKSNCEGYDLDRIYKVDLALLYLAAVELKFIKTPPQVVINEVLNISKKYSTDKSGSFINGVLSKVVKVL